jgi:hypothetical protein
MNWIIFFVVIALVLQIGLLILSRRIRKREKANSIIEKYDIRTRQRAWQLLADPSIPEADRAKIRDLYEAND